MIDPFIQSAEILVIILIIVVVAFGILLFVFSGIRD